MNWQTEGYNDVRPGLDVLIQDNFGQYFAGTICRCKDGTKRFNSSCGAFVILPLQIKRFCLID